MWTQRTPCLLYTSGIAVAEPLLGEVGDDATVINADKEAVAKAITAEAVKTAGYDDVAAAAEDGTAFVFMGHGTAHVAKVSYSQMQTTMETLGYTNVFIGTVEGEPEDTSCEAVIEKVKEAGFTKVVLRPLMVVAGDHANNDMAGDDEDSWLSQFKAADCFDLSLIHILAISECTSKARCPNRRANSAELSHRSEGADARNTQDAHFHAYSLGDDRLCDPLQRDVRSVYMGKPCGT